jgi:hypothetical protein
MFALPYIAYGVVGGFQGIADAVPRAHKGGVEMDAIGWFTLITFFPPIVQFLYAPLVDVWLPRRHWLLIVARARRRLPRGRVLDAAPEPALLRSSG